MPDTNKVIFGDEVLIDLTSDTVSADNMLQGTTAHDASGRSITGAVVVAPIDKEMSSSSKNPVENNVINAAIEKSLSDAKKYSDDKVSNLVGSAPETLDTLEEISRALKDNNQIVDVLNEAISSKVSKEDGKGLSTNDYTNAEKEKLKGIEAGANKTVVDGVLSNTSENPVQNKVITQELNKKGTYSKPTGGIPKTDLASEVQTSLGKADTALQEHQDISGKADKTEVTALYNSISDEWNPLITYAVGQYCIHNNILWKCLVANTNTEPAEGTYWTKVSVASEIASVNSSLELNYCYGYLASDFPLKNASVGDNVNVLRLSRSDNSKGNLITLNEDGMLVFSKSGLVDFTLMFSIQNVGDIYVQVSVTNVLENKNNVRFGQTIRKANDDHASITSRRIIHVNAGDKVAITYKITSWSTIDDNGVVNANGTYKSTGLMAQYVSYDS